MIWDITIARMLHIIAGIIWVGVGLSATLILGSIVRAIGPQKAGPMVKSWYLHTPFLKLIPAAAITTVVTGLYMYGRMHPSTLVGSGSTLQASVLGIGALFGLMAFGHGMFLARLGSKYASLAREAGDEPTQEQIIAMSALGQRIAKNGPIISILLIIAVIGMSSPRYL